MNDESTPLRPEDLPEIAYIERISVSHRKISRADWKNRNIKDINALGAEFYDCDFRYSYFERGYFRDAKFTKCRFTGVRFSDCNFKNSEFYNCDFKFSNFKRCLIDVQAVLPSLPSEPNIRREGLKNLRANAAEIGDYASQGLLILQEIDTTKRHYSHALHGYDSYYQEKYPTIFSKLWAGAKLTWLQVGGAIWGHGEKPLRLLISCLLILFVLALINIWRVAPIVGWTAIDGGLRPLEYVIRLFLGMSPKDFGGFVVVDYLVVLARYLCIGLFVSILYKRISHR